MSRGIGPIHLVQVTSEEVGLLPSLGPAYLHDHVTTGVGVRRDQQRTQLLLDHGEGAVGGDQLALHQHSVVAVGPLEQLAAGRRIIDQLPAPPGGVHDRIQFAIARRDLAQLGRVRQDRRVSEPRLKIGVLLLQGGEARREARAD